LFCPQLDNVLLHGRGERPVVKICDFGYSKDEVAGSICKTACGTPEYMAPEVSIPLDGFGSEVIPSGGNPWLHLQDRPRHARGEFARAQVFVAPVPERTGTCVPCWTGCGLPVYRRACDPLACAGASSRTLCCMTAGLARGSGERLWELTRQSCTTAKWQTSVLNAFLFI